MTDEQVCKLDAIPEIPPGVRLWSSLVSDQVTPDLYMASVDDRSGWGGFLDERN